MARKPQNQTPEPEVNDEAETPVNESEMTTLTYGDDDDEISVAIADLPAKTQFVLMSRGFTHILGNEVASKVTSRKQKHKADAMKEAGDNWDESKYVPMTDEEVAALTASLRAEAVQKMRDGKLGLRVGTSRGTALDTIVRRIATAELRARLEKNGAKLPQKATDEITVSGTKYTRQSLIAAYIKSHEARLTDEAKAEQAKLAALAESVEKDKDLGEVLFGEAA